MSDAGPTPPPTASGPPPAAAGAAPPPSGPGGRNRNKKRNKPRNRNRPGPGGAGADGAPSSGPASDGGSVGPGNPRPRRRNNARRNRSNRSGDSAAQASAGVGGTARPPSGDGRAGDRSPLHLPHVKVTIRNILPSNPGGSGDDPHLTAAGLVDSVAGLVEGAFPPPGRKLAEGSAAYLEAWRAERTDFEAERAMFAEHGGGGGGGMSGGSPGGGSPGSSAPGGRGYPAAWVYEDRPAPLPPGDRSSLLPSVDSVVARVMDSLPPPGDIVRPRPPREEVVDRAMSEMLAACGAAYLGQCGGRAEADGTSGREVSLPGEMGRVRDEMERERAEREAVEGIAGDGKGEEGKAEDSKEDAAETAPKADAGDAPPEAPAPIPPPAPRPPSPSAVRVRVLSATPAKRSKRRGVVGGRVALVLYPPDPCALFGDRCRDAGRGAAAAYAERYPADASGADGSAAPAPASVSVPRYPPLTAPERSRCLARSRALLSRTVAALRVHAASGGSGGIYAGWDIRESPSQKAWRTRAGLGGAAARLEAAADGRARDEILRELVRESMAKDEKEAEDGAAPAARRGFYGDSRSDRHDSTIESTEDYASFLEWHSGDRARPYEGPARGRKKAADADGGGGGGSSNAKADAEVEVDEEGRPLSAIVLYFRARNAEASMKRKAEQRRKDAARKEEKRRKEKARKAARRQEQKEKGNKKEKRRNKGGGGKQGQQGKGQASAAQQQRGGGPVVLAKKPEGGGAGGILPPSGY